MVPPRYYFGERYADDLDEDNQSSEDSDLEEFSDDDLKELEKRPYFQWEEAEDYVDDAEQARLKGKNDHYR